MGVPIGGAAEATEKRDEQQLTRVAPAAAPVAARAAQIAPVFGHTAVRATGLEQSCSVRKRSASVQRSEPCWECVVITNEDDAHQPLSSTAPYSRAGSASAVATSSQVVLLG